MEEARLVPLRAPEPERPFVGREYELGLIAEKVTRGKAGERIPSPIVCFWGAFGMGKSWLLIGLQQEYGTGGAKGQGKRPTIVARLDLDRKYVPALWDGRKLDCGALIEEIWRQLARQMDSAPPDLGPASAKTWADALVEQLSTWSLRFVTPIIMLDSMDELLADEESFFWLEKEFIERLALLERVLFALQSRTELRQWDRFQVRRRVELHRLQAFDETTAGRQVSASGAVSRALYREAFGHPWATERLATRMVEAGIDLRAAVMQIPLTLQALKVVGTVIEEMMGDQPEDKRDLFRRLSLLRWVSAEFVALARRATHPEAAAWSDSDYDRLIRDLQSRHLLYYNSVHSRYEPDPTLRRLLNRFLEVSAHDVFMDVHLTAYAFHAEHLQKRPAFLARYVPELAYHRALLAPEEPPPALRSWWKQFLQRKTPLAPEPWEELVEALEGDKELEELLPRQDRRALLSAAQERSRH